MRLKHVLMWKMKPQANGRTKDENIDLCTAALYDLERQIEEVRGVEVGRNFAIIDNAYDLVVTVEFDNRAAFLRFLDHPAHKALGELVIPLRDDSIVVDYELPGQIRSEGKG